MKGTSFTGKAMMTFIAGSILVLGATFAVSSLWPYNDVRIGDGAVLVTPTDAGPVPRDPDLPYKPGETLYYERDSYCNDGVALEIVRLLETNGPNGAGTVFDSIVRFPAPAEPGCFYDGVVAIPVPESATPDREWRFRFENTYQKPFGREVTVISYSPWFTTTEG